MAYNKERAEMLVELAEFFAQEPDKQYTGGEIAATLAFAVITAHLKDAVA